MKDTPVAMQGRLTESAPQPWDGVTDRRTVTTVGYEGIERRVFDLLAAHVGATERNGQAPSMVLDRLDDITTPESTTNDDEALQEIRHDIASLYGPLKVTNGVKVEPDETTKLGTTVLTAPAKSEVREQSPNFSIRYATPKDIDAIVEVDMQSFSSVYESYGMEDDELRADLHKKFTGRLEKVGADWMPVLERDGKVVGFMSCCPTSKRPEDFESWEKTTDSGTLETTYDPQGKNIYVVSLSVSKEGSEGKDMLYANQIGKALREGYELSFFESRMPGLRAWARRQSKIDGTTLDALSEDQLNSYARTYYGKTIERDGKQVPYDPLLRLYNRIGCNLLKVVPNAYQDEPSMNFGVVCTYDFSNLFDGSVLRVKIPRNKATKWLLGAGIQAAAKSRKLANGMFK